MVATSTQKNKSSEFISDFVDKGYEKSCIDNGNACLFSLNFCICSSTVYRFLWVRAAVDQLQAGVHVYCAEDAELQGRAWPQ